jgi:hypothetical protein
MALERHLLVVVVLSILTRTAWSQSLDEVQPPHDATNAIGCGSCHVPFGTAPVPVPDNWTSFNVCWSCHEESGIAPWMNIHLSGSDTVAWCKDCHNPHQHQDVFPQWYIRDNINTPSNGGRALLFSNSTDFIHGATGGAQPYDGICETCHTQTNYHRNNASGDHNHFADQSCVSCHSHENGFLPSGGNACLACHSSPTGSRRAISNDFTRPGGHHPLTYNTAGDLDTPQDNNCIICHLEGSDPGTYHANGSVDLNPDPDNSGSSEWQGNPAVGDAAFSLDPNSPPSWWCMDCHDGSNPDPSYRLNGLTATNKSDFWTSSTHNALSTNSGAIWNNNGCTGCHKNGHTQEQEFFSIFYLDSKEENNCYGCHGGTTMARRLDNVVMEGIRQAFGIPGTVANSSKHSAEWNISASDGHTICRDCHNPHRMDYDNMLCDPDNPEVVWTGAINDFCIRCHDGDPEMVPVHSGVTITGEACNDCHLPHSSSLPSLMKLDIGTRTTSVSPTSAVLTIGQTQSFNDIVSPAYSSFTQDVVNRLSDWGYTATSGGSVGTEYTRFDSIPLDRSIGYDPSGWGLITVTSQLVINDNVSINDLNFHSDIPHHYRGDLTLTLRHLDTGTEVKIQEYSWSDWLPDLIFWYDSESPNGQFSSVSPRSTAESLTAFRGESTSGTWELTIEDTWPSDNPTNPANPDFCWVRSWALAINGGVLGSITTDGDFTAEFEGTGNMYATLHEGAILPDLWGGIYVSVWENPPLVASAALSIGPVRMEAPSAPSGWSVLLGAPSRGLQMSNPGRKHQTVLNSGQDCNECHRR